MKTYLLLVLLCLPLFAKHQDEASNPSKKTADATKKCEELDAIWTALDSLFPKVSETAQTLPVLKKSEKDAFETSLDVFFNVDGSSQPKDIEDASKILNTEKALPQILNRVEEELKKPSPPIRKLSALNYIASELSAKNNNGALAQIGAQIAATIYLGGVGPKTLLDKFSAQNKKHALKEYMKFKKTDENRLKELEKELGQITIANKGTEPFTLEDRVTEFNLVKNLEGGLRDNSNQHTYYDEIAGALKNKGEAALLSCHDKDVQSLYQMVKKSFFSKRGAPLENILVSRQGEGQEELQEAMKSGNYAKLPQVARENFYNPTGIQASLLNSILLLKNEQPLLAATELQGALESLPLLIEHSKGELNKKFVGLQKQLQIAAMLAYKKINDTENLEKLEKGLDTNIDVLFNEKTALSADQIKKGVACLSPEKDTTLLENYLALGSGETEKLALHALVVNSPYLHSLIEKRIPNIENKMEPYFEQGWLRTGPSTVVEGKAQKIYGKAKGFNSVTIDITYGPFCVSANLRTTLWLGKETALKTSATAHASSPILELALNHKNQFPLNEAAADLLKQKGEPSIPRLISGLKENPLVFVENAGTLPNPASHALAEFGEKAIEPLKELYKDPASREIVARTFSNMGENGTRSLVSILENAKNEEEKVPAFTVLSPNITLIPLLKKLLAGPDSENFKYQAAYKLGRLGENALLPLSETLKDSPNAIKLSALRGLALDGQAKVPGEYRLFDSLLSDKNPTVRYEAIQLLDRMSAFKESSAAVIPTLQKVLLEDESKAKELAAGVLAKIGEKSLPAFTEGLKNKDPEVRKHAAKGLGSLGEKVNENTVTELRNALSDKEESVRIAATITFSQIGEKAKVAIPDLIKNLETDKANQSFWLSPSQWHITTPTIWALSKIEGAASELKVAAQDKNEKIATGAKDALELQKSWEKIRQIPKAP